MESACKITPALTHEEYNKKTRGNKGGTTIQTFIPRSIRDVFEHIETATNPDTGMDEAVSFLNGYRLSSVFQPIFSFAHARPVGHEALVRATDPDGQSISPIDLFSRATGREEIVTLDRLCRAMHVRNFSMWAPENTWLFLNVMPDAAVEGARSYPFFSEMLNRVGVSPHSIVIEMLEHSIADESAFHQVVQYYRNIGCLLAVDDFGTGASNFHRIWDMRPDIVKFDRSITVKSAKRDFVRRSLPGLVSLLHETGSLILMEGIETRDEALVAMHSDVDMLQGYYFSKPAPRGEDKGGSLFFPADLIGLERNEMRVTTPYSGVELHQLKDLFLESARVIENGEHFKNAVFRLLGSSGVARCYMLDSSGQQLKGNMVSRLAPKGPDARFDPLMSAKGANWMRRPYFQRAMARPGELQISRPYLSLTGSHMTVTLSQAFSCAGEASVFCCDLDWEWLSQN